MSRCSDAAGAYWTRSAANDYFPGKGFKQTVFQARQLHIAFDIAMVADHTFYGTKGILKDMDLPCKD